MEEKHKSSYKFIIQILRIRNVLVSKFISFRSRILAFFIFFLLSAAFWFYRALDDTYADNINYPLRYINLPQNKILANKPLDKITIRVRGNGYTLLNNKINPPTLELNVNDFSLGIQSIDSLSLFLISKQAKEIFAAELSKKNNDPLEILATYPDTIIFNFTKTKTKQLKVLPNISDWENLYARQYMLNGDIQIEPSFITAIGPSSVIDTLTGIYTEKLNITSLKDSLTKKVKIDKLKGIRFLHKKVTILIPVDKFTETTVNVPINIKNKPDSINLKVFPGNVDIKYIVTLSNYENVTADSFKPYIDYFDAVQATSSEQKIMVYCDSVPIKAHSINIDPKSVEFLIEKKRAENRTNRGDR